MSFTALSFHMSVSFIFVHSLVSLSFAHGQITRVGDPTAGKRIFDSILEYLNEERQGGPEITLQQVLEVLKPRESRPLEEEIEIKNGRLCHLCHHPFVKEELPCCETSGCCHCVYCNEGSEML
jgi:hypothetical protein